MEVRGPGEASNVPDVSRNLDPARERAILEAVLELLAELGYDRMSIDEVARRARASKATIYRRWSGKAAMVAAAMHLMTVEHPPLPDTGTLRGDLIAALSIFSRIYERKRPIVSGLIAAIRSDPELGQVLHGHLLDAGAAEANGLVARARARGELTGDPDLNALVEVTKALLWHRLLLTGEALDDGWVTHVANDILLPLLRARPAV